MNKEFGYIYFMTNEYNTTFYIGVTSDLKRRIYEHKNKIIDGFTKNYNLTKLVYFEKYTSIVDAIKREKQLKNFKRKWKIDLIKKYNPFMMDLYNWLEGNQKEFDINVKLIEENNITYEVPDCAIAGRLGFVPRSNSLTFEPSGSVCSIFSLSGPISPSTNPQARNDVLRESSIKIQCPAKINLTLKVTGKRPDGFHNIESIMQTISLYDYLTIKIEPSEKMEILLSGNSKEIPYNEKNLVYKAIQLFPMSPHKVEIYIEKHIPISAGLAGGSTDCAGTLFGLNELLGEPLTRSELHELCAKLGSDLNLCLEGGRQMTRGRGEILEPLEFEPFNVSLIKPENLGISAKEAYTKFSQKQGVSNFKNDLEWAIIDDYKELQKIKELYPQSMMSGSGSTYFVINDKFKPLKGYEVFNDLKAITDGVKSVR